MKQILMEEEVHKQLMLTKIQKGYKSISETMYYALKALEREENENEISNNGKTTK